MIFSDISALIGFRLFIIFSYSSGRSIHLLSGRLIKYSKGVYEWNDEYQKIRESVRSLPYKNSVASSHLANTMIVSDSYEVRPRYVDEEILDEIPEP